MSDTLEVSGDAHADFMRLCKEHNRVKAELAAAKEDADRLAGLLHTLYIFPGVRELLAPKESLGSIANAIETQISAHRKSQP